MSRANGMIRVVVGGLSLLIGAVPVNAQTTAPNLTGVRATYQVTSTSAAESSVWSSTVPNSLGTSTSGSVTKTSRTVIVENTLPHSRLRA